MRIGLIGGPEAGKTALAKYIQKEYKDYALVDDYVKRLSDRTGTAFGPFANHLGNIQIAIERLNCELEAPGADNFITCGTLIETLAYDASYSVSSMNERIERARVSVTMDFFGMMMQDTYLYDRLFFLPSKDENLDFQIKYAIRLFGLRPLEVTEDYDKVIENIKEWEKIVKDAEATEVDGSGIRSSE